MSYDISLCDPVTHKPLKADSTHFIAGGMRAMGGTKELWLNVTYNYGHFYYRPEVFGENGIRSIYGKTGAESGQIEQDADAIILLAQNVTTKKRPEQHYHFALEKNKEGNVGSLDITFQMETQQFKECVWM